ncbi:MAG TPA: YdeI/OmpD-associated family protein [Catalimonadaceae bacterium]|nr:YdeI/OmpD-associated family protein [Catalimonadaceae bacterium]
MEFHSGISTYIESAAPFARPILNQLRTWVHQFCPEVTETVKWSFPHFEYKGRILCSMAAFSKHCAFGFWLESVMKDPHGIMEHSQAKSSMGNLGRISSLDDLPSEIQIRDLILEAMMLIDAGVKPEKKKTGPVKELESPADLMEQLQSVPVALEFYRELPPGQKKEYILWVTEAKTEATRSKRIETTVLWCSERKRRLWKYESC